ncbi:enoyl-CoA hydratase/isomerase family protein [Neobacillus niacini]|uniref:enoyl-CoA hydratase/isomerase family protein n=1 Tax=Neobacillus niacini TaxID=86668 RepID=UPI0021CB6A1B|nr:enoyl-CoA hydratase-related protein [Neobacillus niacini]MCM3766193.1 enoyl-CoA hydratase-related protein [Neobacillus niacini]
MSQSKTVKQGKFINLEINQGIAEIIINNPPVNALSTEVMIELSTMFDSIEQNKDVRVVIITGEGDKFFVAGADIKQFPHLNSVTGEEMVRVGQDIFNKINKLNIPFISAVNGYALGAGCELALACDIRIASSHAKFGLPESGLGIIPGYGGTQRLPRLVGIGKAKEMIFTGEPISADEAHRIGLVERLVTEEDLMQHAREFANKIISKGPIAIAKAKYAINQGMQVTLQEGQDIEALCSRDLFGTEDKNEGAKAFFEKRKPVFKGI